MGERRSRRPSAHPLPPIPLLFPPSAIQVNGNDHYILNTIVFSSKIGVEVNGAADVCVCGARSPTRRSLPFFKPSVRASLFPLF